ncbi:MAG: chemotaxis protein CheW [Halieaceae bacterium]|jgi:purine-binding chemotaxis protein CheW|nr:chemotaxis protein CheW [Halieaceae bacterium]
MSKAGRANAASSGQHVSSAPAIELIIFRVEELVCAIDIANAQEIKCQLKIIEVPETTISVRGVANLRGQVITVIDLRVVFGIEPKEVDSDSRIVVVRHDGGVVGLLVDYVDDIVSARHDDLEPPPANISGVRGEFFDAVFKRPEDLACLLNIDRILAAV